MVIDKFMLLAGRDFVKEIEIENVGTVKIKPLTSLEVGEVDRRRFKGIMMKENGMALTDSGLLKENEMHAQNLVVEKGLVEPKLTLEEIESLPYFVVSGIANEIMQITGAYEGVKEDIENFR